MLLYTPPQIQTSSTRPEPDQTQLAAKCCRYLKLLRNKTQFTIIRQQRINVVLTEYIAQIVNQFKFSNQTKCLGIYLFFTKITNKISYNANQLVYAAMALLLAAKTLENSIKIPKLSVFKQFACSYISLAEYSKAEREILELLEYKIELSTFLTYLNFYLENQNQQIRIQTTHRVDKYLEDAAFLKQNQEKLAIFILAKARQSLHLGWTSHEQTLTQTSESDMNKILTDIIEMQAPRRTLERKRPKIIILKEIMPARDKSNIVQSNLENCSG